MSPLIQIAPAAVLLAGAAVAVWRGFDPKSDKTGSKKGR